MTLRALFQLLSDNPIVVMFYFLAVPLTALLAGWLGRGEGHLTPWKNLYTLLIYLSVIPAIFGVFLTVYLFLFERQSILDTNIYTQILPVISMALTLWLIRRNVSFEYIPGFNRLSGLFVMIAAVLMLMWIFDRTRLLVFSYMPFQYVLFIFVAILVAIRWGWSRIAR